MKPAQLMGRLSNGFEADQGKRIHAVPDNVGHYGLGKALCGAKPGRRSGGWDVDHHAGRAVTCPRCVARMPETCASCDGPLNSEHDCVECDTPIDETALETGDVR